MTRVDATNADLIAIDGRATLSPELRRVLRDARVDVESLSLDARDRDDVADALRRLTAELAVPAADADPRRTLRCWRRIERLAPTVAQRLAGSPAIRERSEAWGEAAAPRGGYLNEAAARALVEAETDPGVRRAFTIAHAEMVDGSFFDGLRPAGTFDLRYFYELLGRVVRALATERPESDDDERSV